MYREYWWDKEGNGDDEEGEPQDEPHESGGTGCAVEEIMTALEGCIMTDLLPLASHSNWTASGRVSIEG